MNIKENKNIIGLIILTLNIIVFSKQLEPSSYGIGPDPIILLYPIIVLLYYYFIFKIIQKTKLGTILKLDKINFFVATIILIILVISGFYITEKVNQKIKSNKIQNNIEIINNLNLNSTLDEYYLPIKYAYPTQIYVQPTTIKSDFEHYTYINENITIKNHKLAGLRIKLISGNGNLESIKIKHHNCDKIKEFEKIENKLQCFEILSNKEMNPDNEFSFSLIEEYFEEITEIHVLKISNKDSKIKQMSEKYESYHNVNKNEITGIYTIVNSK